MKSQSKRTSRLFVFVGVVVAIIIAVLSWRYFGTGSDNNTSGAQQSARGQDTSHGGRRNTPLAPCKPQPQPSRKCHVISLA